MERLQRIRWVLPVVAWFALLATPPAAHATLYELVWAYKWGSGDIIFDGSVPDSNPNPDRGDYFGAIVSYDLQIWTDSLDAVHLAGSAGAISVQNPGPPPADPDQCASPPDTSRCPGAALTFQLGSAAPPYDPAGWQLSLIAPRSLGNFFDQLPTDPLQPGPCGSGADTCTEFSSYNFAGGVIAPNTPDGRTYIPVFDPTSGLTLKALAVTAVPEPATVALFAAGLAMLAAALRKRAPLHRL
ncbi:MAG TPA: PEP-CTERM sorting domain-containing protein [Burkholderiaceae bacterium]|nr:PEP-CTERM sorting domain-containing protein [Burkholderiaceae bacterium]